MILPTKYLDLESSVLRLAAFILEELKREPMIRLAELASRVDEYASGKGRFNFFPSLNVLFLTGQIEYSDDDDVIVRRNAVPARVA
jgi:hypothetical protein